jgi:hypothetical protein
MIFLDRTTISAPTYWQGQVHKKLPDPEAYARKAREFESLPIDDHRRRAGFTHNAPEVLPTSCGRPIFPEGVEKRLACREYLGGLIEGQMCLLRNVDQCPPLPTGRTLQAESAFSLACL